MRNLTKPHVALVIVTVVALTGACTASADPTTTTTTTLATTTTTTLATTTTTAPSTTTTTLPDEHGGEVIIGIASEPATLNPFFSTDPATALIAEAWTVGVQDISGETGDYVPDVVETLPTVANGGVVANSDGTMTVTYRIREEAAWADGTPITGADFQFTLETILDPGLALPKGLYADILSSTVGEKTFGYTLAFTTIAHEELFDILIPAHQVAGTDFAADWNDHTWLSAGPFSFQSWTEGQSISFSRNAEFWKVDETSGRPLPFLDGVTFQVLTDPTARWDAIAGGAVAAINADADVPAVDQYTVLPTLGAEVITRPGPVWVHLNFQFGPSRFDRNPDTLNEYLSFRQGLMMAIDRQRIAEAVHGERAVPLNSYVDTYNSSLSQGAWDQYPFDPVEAIARINAAAAERKAADPEATDDLVVFFTTNASNEERVAVAGLIAEMLAEIGVALLDTSENSITFFGETVGDGRFDVSMWAWQADEGLTSLVQFHDVLDPRDDRALTNFYRWGTQESSVIDDESQRYASILSALETTADRDGVITLLQQAEQLIADQALFLPLYAEPESTIYWPEQIQGFSADASELFTWNIEHWQLPES